MTPYRAAALAAVILIVVAVALLVTLVPWGSPPEPPRAVQVAAVADLPADAVARGKEFHAALRPGGYAAMVVGLAVALLLGLTPLGARLVALVGRPFGGHWIAEAVLGGLVVVFVGQIAVLPFAAWRYTVLRRYGLSTQDWAGWAADVGKSALVTAVLGAIVLLGFYTAVRLLPRWWWAAVAAGAMVLVAALSLLFPVLVEPMFNKFTPMPAGQQREELLAMAARDGVPVRDVLIADASRRTRAVNAYVSGYGPTRRIVVYDTLLEEPQGEVALVVAHELGHAKRGDVVIGTALGALGAAGAVCVLFLVGGWGGLLRRAGLAGDAASLGDPRSVALIMALAAVVGLFAGPAQNLVSRRIEARADAHALALTGDPATFEAMQRRLALRNLADVDPNRLEYLLFASHPSTAERIAAAREYARRHPARK